MNIELIHLKGFKSAASIRFENAAPFAVLAGANGAGKSNLADGLAFFGAVIKRGAVQAIRDYGGYAHIHCFKHRKEAARVASLALKITLQDKHYDYQITIYQMDKTPQLTEKLIVDGQIEFERERGKPFVRVVGPIEVNSGADFPEEMSTLLFMGRSPLYQFLTNIKVFRFDPLSAKEPAGSSTDGTMLDSHGRNVATMLSVLEKNPEFREQVLEWIELLVPGMEGVSTKKQRLDGSTVITFKEEGTKARFPARLISDGTIYALCIMTAILSRSSEPGLTLIEEPERGIHPKGIAELVSLMRENAQVEHPVFVTTHSESVVRSIDSQALWLVNKVDGKTQLKNAAKSAVDLGELNLDTAWLMNFFDGGLPW